MHGMERRFAARHDTHLQESFPQSGTFEIQFLVVESYVLRLSFANEVARGQAETILRHIYLFLSLTLASFACDAIILVKIGILSQQTKRVYILALI